MTIYRCLSWNLHAEHSSESVKITTDFQITPALPEWHTAETTVFLLRSRFSLSLLVAVKFSDIENFHLLVKDSFTKTRSKQQSYDICYWVASLLRWCSSSTRPKAVKSIVVWRTCGCSDILFQRSPPLVWNVTVINNVLPSRVKLP